MKFPEPAGFRWLIAAQFLSALADYALLMVGMAHLQAIGAPVWWAPLLKLATTVSYVLLAPFVGVVADRVCKRRLMFATHGLKALAALLLFGGAPILLAFAVLGVGASAYAPAKYGLLTESIPPEGLVRANGWAETAVVLSVLLGTALGGALVSPLWLQSALVTQIGGSSLARPGASTPALNVSLLVVLGLYAVAGACHLGIRPSGALARALPSDPAAVVWRFRHANLRLWRDVSGGMSLAVTTIFWGFGALLQFAVLQWGTEVLGVGLDRAAGLQGMVAVGVVLGAAGVATRTPLWRATRTLTAGVAMGVLVALTPWTSTLWLIVPALTVLGALGGIMVVPMNALLQHRGHRLLGAGQSIAVQGYNENLSILVMLGLYAGLLALGGHVQWIMAASGLLLAAWSWMRIPARRRSRPIPVAREG